MRDATSVSLGSEPPLERPQHVGRASLPSLTGTAQTRLSPTFHVAAVAARKAVVGRERKVGWPRWYIAVQWTG